MEVPHSDALKKLEGRKDRKGYIQILSEGQMSVADKIDGILDSIEKIASKIFILDYDKAA